MTATMVVITLCAFLVGVAIGWRHFKIGGLFLLFALMLAFAALDYAIDRIVVWPHKYWLILDLVAAQTGYLIGASFGMITSGRKDRNRRKPD